MQRLKTVFGRAFSDDLPDSDRFGKAGECDRLALFALKEFAYEAPCGRRDEHRTRCGVRDETSRKARRLAQSRLLSRVAKQTAHEDETRRYGDTGLHAVGLTYIGPARCLDQAARRANRTFRLVFVCLRVAEIGQNPVIQQLGDVAARFRDDCRTALMKGVKQPMQIFWIAPCGLERRARHGALHDGQLAPLGGRR